MIPTIDKVRLDTAAQLTLETGFSLAWAPGAAMYLTKLDGWTGSSPVRRSKSEILGGHGTHGERGFKDERLISASGHAVFTTRAAAAAFTEEAAAFLGDGTRGLFRVEDPDLGLRTAKVYLASSGVDVAWTGGVDVPFTVHMLSPDPRKYGPAVTSPATGIPVPGDGLIYPLFSGPAPGVLNLGAGGVSGKVGATNTGRADTGVLFTVTGDYVPGFTITSSSGRRLVYTQTINSGQVLTLDSDTGQVMLDGTAPRTTELRVAEWERLDGGESATWLFESPGSLNAALTVTVAPAWW